MSERPFHLSQNTRDKLIKLSSIKFGVLKRVMGTGKAEAVHVLKAIAEDDQLVAVSSLMGYTAPSSPVREASRDAVIRIMSNRSPKELGRLDEVCRNVPSYALASYNRRNIQPADVSSYAQTRNADLLGLLAMHPDGHVRGRAVEQLAKLKTPRAVTYLLIRCNDWVDEVRGSALKAVEAYLSRWKPIGVSAMLGMVSTLRRKTRNDLSRIEHLLQDLFRKNPDRLLEATQHPNRDIRRSAFETAYAVGGDDKGAFIRQALSDCDAIVRLRAADAVRSVHEAAERYDLTGLMLSDRWHAVRYRGLHLLIEREDGPAVEALHRLLFDRSATIRSSARYYLELRGVENFSVQYRKALSENPTASSILGLGECGDAGDAITIMPYLKHDDTTIRAASITAYGRLSGEDSDDVLAQALRDKRAAPSNAAYRQLRQRMSAALRTKIAGVYRDESLSPRARYNALQLLSQLDKWSRLEYWLEGLSSADERIARQCSIGIEKWQWHFNRSFAQPGPEQVARIRELRARSEHPALGFLDSVLKNY